MRKLAALRSNDIIEDKRIGSLVSVSNHSSTRSQESPSVSAASLSIEADRYPQSKTELLQELIPAERRSKKSRAIPDPTHYKALSGSRETDTRNNSDSLFCFSEIDKRVLRSLLDSGGKMSSLGLSRKLEIPYTTIFRRRKRLESEFVERSYSLKLDRLGWRVADMLISTRKGRSSIVGKELLALNNITQVRKTIGEQEIDLHAIAVFRNNRELSSIIEWIKTLEGVDRVVWIESVEMLGNNGSMQEEIFDSRL